MAPKGRKKRNSKDSTSSNGGSGEGDDKKKKEGGSKKKSSGGKSLGCDIFNDAAMENAYYVCHNVQDVLKSRGFAWPDGQKKKKKGKR
ncbi:small lysine-rich protein 1 [Lucilia cuprina]|uniref:small lysine-rich protein 1 n=1 Tax=Lucilia cuprina TaxID=7375 RepID=UPI000C718C31|nr:small lysine-rich protein 1 [Lucilia cuprina]XP_037819962.1 small lysine-rich protein 1 [Lucilia sericata]KAI8130437.1 Small lysine-rich protein 1 [Lucilia cuprina]